MTLGFEDCETLVQGLQTVQPHFAEEEPRMQSSACTGYGLRHTWAYTDPSTSHEPFRPKVVVEIFPGSRASSMTKPAHTMESVQLPAKLA